VVGGGGGGKSAHRRGQSMSKNLKRTKRLMLIHIGGKKKKYKGARKQYERYKQSIGKHLTLRDRCT